MAIKPRHLADQIESTRIVSLAQHRLSTQIWAGPPTDAPTNSLVFIPNFGIYHRLVVNSPYIDWRDDSALLVGNLLIRFVTGSVAGEKISPMDEVAIDNGQTSITGESTGSAIAKGRFIEVVAPASSPREAKQAAYSLLGLVSLVMGEQAIGEIIFSEAYEAQPGKQQGGIVQIPIVAKVPRAAPHDETDQISLMAPTLLVGDRLGRARQRALRWYFFGITSSTPEDKLFAFFIGMECLVNACASEYGPIPASTNRQKNYESLLRKGASELDTESLMWLKEKIAEPTLRERAKVYAESRDLDDTWIKECLRVNQCRNEVFHGRVADVDETVSATCKRLLVQMIKAELGVVGKLPWEAVPGLGLFLGLSYSLTDPEHLNYPPIDHDEEPV